MIRLRSSSPVSPAPALLSDVDDLLREILIRLPPLPCSLPRASPVCKRWHRLVSDPVFFRRFRDHHRKPPLLGFFYRDGCRGSIFTPTLEPPDRIPGARFSPTESRGERWLLVDCRHGLALLLDQKRREALVWEPITGHPRRVALPPGRRVANAAVLCVAGDVHGHVHGDCHLSPFKLVLVRNNKNFTRAFARLYDSESGVWGDVITTTITDDICPVTPSVLVGNSVCWMFSAGDILQFDLEKQSLVVIEKPADARVAIYSSFWGLRTEENGLGLAVLTGPIIEIWARNVNSNGVVRWVLKKTIDLDMLFPLRLTWHMLLLGLGIWSIQGFDEEADAIFLSRVIGVIMVQFDSLQFRNICKMDHCTHYPSLKSDLNSATVLNTVPRRSNEW